jgi:CMP-N,N'-diacetyllegionaminic acid synthase
LIGNERVLAVIPARGGSKGVPGKNIREAGGKPLIAWAIDAARGVERIDRAIVSSDDAAIIAAARKLGADVPFVREARLASDQAAAIDVVLDALARCPGHAWVVLLQPTSPLRTAADIDGAIDRCIEAKAPSCVSVCAVSESPYWMYRIGAGGQLQPLLGEASQARRQDLPAVYVLNGAIYVARADWLARGKSFVGADTVAYVMPAERSLDIDTEDDFHLLKTRLESHDVSLSPAP